jgi:peptidoglycan-N-acetylglucosamine deacetylase
VHAARVNIRAAIAAALLLLLTACGSGGAGSPVASAASTPWPATTPQPTTEATPAPTPAPRPSPSATPPPTASAVPTATPLQPPASLAGAEWTRLPTQDRVVALTFDSGSNDAGVASILDTLSAQQLDATFFLTGRFAELYPADARRIAAAYALGNHTYTHPHLPQLGDGAVVDEITRAQQAIAAATLRNVRPLFRFPYGDSDARTLSLVHSLGYGAIRWTVDTLGWKGRSAGQSVDTVVQRVIDAAAPGAIVLMHVGAADDGSTLDADALPRVISELRSRGYALVTVSQYVD